MNFSHSCVKVADIENWYQISGIVAVAKPEYIVLKPLGLVCGRNMKKLGDVNYKVLKC